MLNYRLLHGAGFLTCVGAMLFAVLYLQQTLNLDPCPLCMLDRVVTVILGLIFFLALVHNPQRTGQKIYAVSSLLISFIGMGITGRHIWLQSLPPDQVPTCGADFDYMWENWPIAEMLSTILKGTGDCAEVAWEFIGLTIPQQVLLLMIFLAVLNILVIFKSTQE